jgi:hypothetical protein
LLSNGSAVDVHAIHMCIYIYVRKIYSRYIYIHKVYRVYVSADICIYICICVHI